MVIFAPKEIKMIASHNSWTFAKPQWWVRPFAFMSRCQNLTIQQQHVHGIRFFDLRVRWIKNKGMCAVHGFSVYRVNLDADLAFLYHLGGCTVRVLLDLRTVKKSDYEYQKERFKAWIEARKMSFGTIKFMTCRTMPEWEKLSDVEDDNCVEKHASKSKNRLWALCPWLYAKKYNKNVERDTEDIILIDFVNI